MRAVILAGGLGQRLYPLTKQKPKWLLRIGNRTIADYQLEWLKRNGVNEVTVSLNKRHCLITQKYHYGEGIKVELIYEEKPRGDEGALKRVLDYMPGEEVYVINCDVLTDFPLATLKKCPSIALVHPRSPWGIYYDDGSFQEKPILEGIWINSGIYSFPSSIRGELTDEGMLASNIIPKLLRERRLNIAKYPGYWISIETYKDLNL